MENARTSIYFFVNGQEVVVEGPDPEINVLYYLRRNLHLTGTKQGCNEGGCGACTVMLSKYDRLSDKIRHSAVNACLIPLCALDGVAITTIEGIGSTKTKPHPCQERIARCHGSQCGFCTPGMVMSMYTLLRNNLHPTEEEMEKTLHGNLCRCTGYRPILDSFRTFCQGCSCKNVEETDKETKISDEVYNVNQFTELDPSQEPIFPPQLKLLSGSSPLSLQGPRVHWYRPLTLEQLLTLRDQFPLHQDPNQPQYRIVAGNTAIQIGHTEEIYPVVISIDSVLELKAMELNDEGLLIGAVVTIAELEDRLKTIIPTLPESKSRNFSAILEILNWFAGPQIKNVVTIGGIVVSASCTSDIIPILIAVEAKLYMASNACRRESVANESIYSSKKSILLSNEVLVSICIPFSNENEYVAIYKQSRRKHMDSAIVNACMCVSMEDKVVRDCRFVFGGMGEHPVITNSTAEQIIQREWNEELLSIACKRLTQELVLPSDAVGGMTKYRLSLCLSFFYKFYLEVQAFLVPGTVPAREKSSLQCLPQDPGKGSQGFQSVPSSQPIWDSIGRPLMKLSALEQATGEARYVDDIPHFEGELFAGFVLSECAHAYFTVDTSPLENMKGVHSFVSAKDVPGSNITGFGRDEFVFVDGEVTAVGQIIGIVVADNKILAQRAAKCVKITYDELPVVLTMEEAISAGQFYQPEREIKCGDVKSALNEAEHYLEGEMRIGGQEHFYLETCACICIPKGEKGEMEIIASTQDIGGLQRYASTALSVPANRITARVKRIGGGFGGKEIRCDFPYVAVAVAANTVQAPVRAMFERSEDMVNTGARQPFKGIYKVGFTNEGRLTALDIDVYSNAGYSIDLCAEIIDCGILRLQSTYYIPNARVGGHACRTNLPSNTAMRGFGTPQSLLMMENIVSQIADTLGLETEKVRELNLLHDGDRLVYGLILEDCTIQRCWTTLIEQCDYQNRRKEVEEFNKMNRWKKHGISIVPTIHGMSVEVIHINQAGALVHVYTDGSVLLTHGGVEMGQGLHTKMVQVCARCLSIPIEKIYLSETSSDKVPNASATAASISSDMYGMAVKHACDQINERLTPFKEAAPDAGWKVWVNQAYLARVNLSAQGFYKTPDIWMDWEKGTGKPYSYYSYGVGCSVVEVDTLTGSFRVLRSDLLMDVGNSLNPAIDIGQVEGAFTQGLGLFTMEECIFLQDGKMYTKGPGTYKIPGCSDIPIELNVSLLDRCPNPKAIFSSKGIGEPPLFLAASVFFAIKKAVKSARAERGITGPFQFWSPATVERIRLACCDKFVEMIEDGQDEGKTSLTWKILP